MNEERVLLKFDQSGYSSLTKRANETRANVNQLIQGFNLLMFEIQSEKQARELIENPIDYFDSAMFQRCSIDTSKAQPVPEQVAKLYGIDREGFLEVIFGKKAKKMTCKGCISEDFGEENYYELGRDFENYSTYLFFQSGFYHVDTSKLEQAKAGFEVYADETQLKKLAWLNDFVSKLNLAAEMGLITSSTLREFKVFSYDWNSHKLGIGDKFTLINKVKI